MQELQSYFTTPIPEIRLGAVAYDPKVVTIWDGFKLYFESQGLSFDYTLYSNYEAQVEAHFRGDFNVAWNSPLAWLQAQQLAKKLGKKVESVVMRDSDQDLRSLIVVPAESPLKSLQDLKGKRLGVGAHDSPQATLIPLEELHSAGLAPFKDFEVVFHDKLLGKHGDHIGGERDAARALLSGSVDACCMLDSNYLLFAQEGSYREGEVRVLHRTELFDHCNFTVIKGDDLPLDAFVSTLMGMNYEDPQCRGLFDLEGLKAWKVGRSSGYSTLQSAVDSFGLLDQWVEALSKRLA